MKSRSVFFLFGFLILPVFCGNREISVPLDMGGQVNWAGKAQKQQIPFSREHQGLFFRTDTERAEHLQLSLKSPPVISRYKTIYATARFETDLGSPVSGLDLRIRDRDNEIGAISPQRFENKNGTITAEWKITPEHFKITWGTSKDKQNHFMDPPIRIFAFGIRYNRKTKQDFFLTLRTFQLRIEEENSTESFRPLWLFGKDFLPQQSGGYSIYESDKALIVNSIKKKKGWLRERKKSDLIHFRARPRAIELDAEAIGGEVQAEWMLKDAGNRTFCTTPRTIRGKRKTYRFELGGIPLQPPFRVDRLRLQGTSDQQNSLILHDSRIILESSMADALRFDVLTGTPVHVLKYNRPEAFHYQFTNTSRERGRYKVKISLVPYNGQVVSETFEVAAEPGESVVRVPGIRPDRNGHWTAAAEISHPGTNTFSIQRIPFAKLVPAGPTPDGNPEFLFGVCSHPESWSVRDRELEYYAAALCGVKYLRATPGWSHVQPQKGQWNFDYLNQQLEMCGAYGIELQGFLGFNPRWAVSPELQKKHWRVWSRSYPNETAFSIYAQRMAQEFRGRIRNWELWNEPELMRGTINAEEFTRLQKLAYRAVKKGNPDAVMMSGGFAGGNTHQAMYDKQFMEKVLKNASGFYEIHLTHNHGSFGSYVAAVEQHLIPLRKRAGAERIPWFPNETAISSLFGTERNQAETLYKKLIYSWARGAIGYAWYDLRNDGYDATNAEHNYGMLTTDFRPKPIYSVYNHLARSFHRAHFAEQLSAPGGVWAFRFEIPEGQLVPFWNESDLPVLLAVKSDAKNVLLSDFMDNERVLTIQDGIALVQAGNEPGTLRLEGASSATLSGPLLSLESLDAAVPGRWMKVKVNVQNPFPKSQVFQLTVSGLPDGFQVERSSFSVRVDPDKRETAEFRILVPREGELPMQRAFFSLQSRIGSMRTALKIPLNPARLIRGRSSGETDFLLQKKDQVISLTEADPQLAHRLWKGPSDLSAAIRLGERNDALELQVDVTDDIHFQPYSGFDVWRGDNLQFCFKFPSQDDYWEFGASLLNSGKPEMFVFHAPQPFDREKVRRQLSLTAERRGSSTVYRIRIPLKACAWTSAMLRSGFRFNLLVNDNDGEGRDGWIQIAPGIGENKDPERYPFILFE